MKLNRKCPECKHDNWEKVVKRVPIGVSLATRKEVWFVCSNCGHKMKSDLQSE